MKSIIKVFLAKVKGTKKLTYDEIKDTFLAVNLHFGHLHKFDQKSEG